MGELECKEAMNLFIMLVARAFHRGALYRSDDFDTQSVIHCFNTIFHDVSHFNCGYFRIGVNLAQVVGISGEIDVLKVVFRRKGASGA